MRSPTHTSRRRWLSGSGHPLHPRARRRGGPARQRGQRRERLQEAPDRGHRRPASRSTYSAFEAIATANDGNRASGTAGYAASRDYVVGKLRAAGYKPDVQSFDFPFFKENAPSTLRQLSPDATTYDNADDFTTMTYSGIGHRPPVRSSRSTPPSRPSGHLHQRLRGRRLRRLPGGRVALLQRGTCTFGDQGPATPPTAGAAAAIVFNRGTEGNTETIAGTLGTPAEIPALGASFALGQDLATRGRHQVAARPRTPSRRPATTYNVLAETRRGDPDNVVMAGAHLDSVLEGAGINDNGTGSASILEVAEQIAAKNDQAAQQGPLRLVGRRGARPARLDALRRPTSRRTTPRRSRTSRLYLNFDMVGLAELRALRLRRRQLDVRPEDDGAAVGPAGSGAIEEEFADHFASLGLASEETPFSGRSDYGPFIADDIPSGGLFTGAEGVKTAEQAAMYGGTAGVAYD